MPFRISEADSATDPESVTSYVHAVLALIRGPGDPIPKAYPVHSRQKRGVVGLLRMPDRALKRVV